MYFWPFFFLLGLQWNIPAYLSQVANFFVWAIKFTCWIFNVQSKPFLCIFFKGNLNTLIFCLCILQSEFYRHKQVRYMQWEQFHFNGPYCKIHTEKLWMRACKQFWHQEPLSIQHAVHIKVSTNHYVIVCESGQLNYVWVSELETEQVWASWV